MVDARRLSLRRLWFQVHKWIGILLAVLLVPVSLSGSALVWHDALDRMVNPQRFAVSGGVAMSPSAYVDAAMRALPAGDRVSALRLPEGEGAPVVVTAARPPLAQPRPGPPPRTSVWLDPANARVVDVAASSEGLVRWLHVFHGNLQIPGLGRTIVGWLGVAMLLSCISGLWLWWPTVGRWVRGLRWRRQSEFDANLHHQLGFWVAIPLAVLSLTGVWISFPSVFAALTGESARPGGERMRMMRARPLETPRLDVDSALAAARDLGTGQLVSVTWPTDQKGEWRIAFAAAGGKPAEVTVDDRSGAASRAAPAPAPRGNGGIAQLMRRLHDGQGMGLVWQVIIFLGGIIPAALGVTGILMWLRTRRWRSDLARRQKLKRATV